MISQKAQGGSSGDKKTRTHLMIGKKSEVHQKRKIKRTMSVFVLCRSSKFLLLKTVCATRRTLDTTLSYKQPALIPTSGLAISVCYTSARWHNVIPSFITIRRDGISSTRRRSAFSHTEPSELIKTSRACSQMQISSGCDEFGY